MRNNKILLVTVFIIFSINCYAQSEGPVRNPFLTAQEEAFFSIEKREIIEYLTVNAVFFSPGHSYAVIDGSMLKEKDTIDNKEIIEINPAGVILKDSRDNEFVVNVKGVI